MSGRGLDFLENWLNLYVTDADRHGSRERANELAARCVADAASLGIAVDDMEPEWASVETVIYEAMQNDVEAELAFWKSYAATRR